jgi:hypothetical protein
MNVHIVSRYNIRDEISAELHAGHWNFLYVWRVAPASRVFASEQLGGENKENGDVGIKAGAPDREAL